MDMTGITSVTEALWGAEMDYRRGRAEQEWRVARPRRRRARHLHVPVGRRLRLAGRHLGLSHG